MITLQDKIYTATCNIDGLNSSKAVAKPKLTSNAKQAKIDAKNAKSTSRLITKLGSLHTVKAVCYLIRLMRD